MALKLSTWIWVLLQHKNRSEREHKRDNKRWWRKPRNRKKSLRDHKPDLHLARRFRRVRAS